MRGKYIWYAVFATLMSMTKETGLLFAGIFGLFFLAEHFRELLRKGNLKIIALLVVPLVVYLIFLFLQKKAYGTFFFTEHLGLITFKSTKVLNNLRSVSSNLATRYGRNIISLFALISLSVLLIRREKIANTRFMILAIFQVSALILFTILNFYTYRYILPAFPLFIAICLSLIYQARFRMKILNASAYILILAVPLAYSLSKKGKLDNDMGYTQYLKVHKMMVTWCEERGWSDRQFACGYNMVLAMRDPFTGYLHSEKGFRVAHLPGIDQADVVIYDSTCWDGDKPSGFPEGWKLVMRFEVKKHWGEIYVRDK
jgi:hypothetical protein